MKGEQDRDRAIEQLLRATRHGSGPSQSCVDAESLAAWAEGTLSGAEARAIETHASDCDRCQAMLAAFARAEPDQIAPAEPFWHRWRLQWLAPAVAMATVLAIFVAVPRNRPEPVPALESAAVSEETRSSLAVRDLPAPGDDAARRNLEILPSTAGQPGQQQRVGGASAMRLPQQGATTAGVVDGSVVAGALGPPDAGPKREGGAMREQQAAPVVLGKDALAPKLARPDESLEAAAAATASVRRNAAASSETSGTSRQLSAALPAPVAAPPLTSAPVSPPAGAAGGIVGPAAASPLRVERADAGSAQPPIDIASPDAVHRWRIDSARQVQHSSSSGADWQLVALGTSDVITAGTSPDGSVCWLVGRNGAVWLTTDGLRFDRRPLPAAVDLVSVRATDARRATVAAADNRTFATTDGGLTWTPASP